MSKATGMKISVSLPAEDIAFLDSVAVEHGLTRSGVIQLAIDTLRKQHLADECASAFEEWSNSEDQAAWSQADTDLAPEEEEDPRRVHRYQGR